MSKYLIAICLFFSCHRKENIIKQPITFQEGDCSMKEWQKTACKCVKQTFSSNSEFSLVKSFDDSEYKFDSLSYCFKATLNVYSSSYSLDSLYYTVLKNKDVLYVPELIEGSYSEDGERIWVELQFINGALNTPCSTLHAYYLSYSKKKQKVENIILKFLGEQSAQPCN